MGHDHSNGTISDIFLAPVERDGGTATLPEGEQTV